MPNAQRKPGRQDLSQARNGTITGRGGNTQQLGAAATRRLNTMRPAKPAAPMNQTPPWQQLRQAGIPGQGSPAANRAALANLNKPDILTAMPPEKPGMGEVIGNSGGLPAGGMGGPGSDMGFQSGGGFMAPPVGSAENMGGTFGELPRFGGGMASFTKPGALAAQGGPMAAAGPMGGPPKPGVTPPAGVDSNPFAQMGTAQDGEPLQEAQGRAGQAGRIAQLIRRLRGGGGPQALAMGA